MDAMQKLKITNRARSRKLWEQACEFKESQRSVLRAFGLSRQDAVHRAWMRLDLMLDEVSPKTPNPFKPIEIPWNSLHDCDAMEPGEFDRDSGWAFCYFLETNVSPPSEFAESFVSLGREQIGWFLPTGAAYFSSARIEQPVLV